MNEPANFKRIRALFGTMDDLCQERRKAYTDWATQRTAPEAFVAVMAENLRRTREAAEELGRLLEPDGPPKG